MYDNRFYSPLKVDYPSAAFVLNHDRLSLMVLYEPYAQLAYKALTIHILFVMKCNANMSMHPLVISFQCSVLL